MDETITSEGKCLFCGKTFKSGGINRHLQTHFKKLVQGKENGLSFLLKIEPNIRYWPGSGYFLYVWVDGKTKMETIDGFLRDIWLECCGHLSAFRNPNRRSIGMWDFFEAEELLEKGRITEYENLMEDATGEVPMSRKAQDVFYKDLKLEYEYDFGSSTNLTVTTSAEVKCKAEKPIVLLSRNEPLEVYCQTCGKEPAVELCSIEDWEADYLFCSKCAKKHAKTCDDFADYAAMPVVNSPRMGVCGYVGGTIDLDRDKIVGLKIVK